MLAKPRSPDDWYCASMVQTMSSKRTKLIPISSKYTSCWIAKARLNIITTNVSSFPALLNNQFNTLDSLSIFENNPDSELIRSVNSWRWDLRPKQTRQLKRGSQKQNSQAPRLWIWYLLCQSRHQRLPVSDALLHSRRQDLHLWFQSWRIHCAFSKQDDWFYWPLIYGQWRDDLFRMGSFQRLPDESKHRRRVRQDWSSHEPIQI